MQLRIILFISGEQGLITLKLCLIYTNNIVVVIPEGVENDDIIEFCKSSNLTFMYRDSVNPVDIKRGEFDLLLSSSFQFLIQKEEYSSTLYGGINIHASILPTYKGKHSDVWALINDEKSLGVTVHELNERFDDGRILKIYKTKINDQLSNGEIYQKVKDLFPELIKDICTLKIFQKNHKPDGKDIYWRVRTIEDSRIDWSKSARKIFLFVRALSRPPIYAYSFHKRKKYSFLNVQETKIRCNDYPGTVLEINQEYFIVCGDKRLVKVLGLLDNDVKLIKGTVLQ